MILSMISMHENESKMPLLSYFPALCDSSNTRERTYITAISKYEYI